MSPLIASEIVRNNCLRKHVAVIEKWVAAAFIDSFFRSFVRSFINLPQMSRLVASEIVRRSCLAERVAVIEKWVAVGDICRCLHNYNGVLAICCAFTNSSVYRLKKTWEKLSKQVRFHPFCLFINPFLLSFVTHSNIRL